MKTWATKLGKQKGGWRGSIGTEFTCVIMMLNTRDFMIILEGRGIRVINDAWCLFLDMSIHVLWKTLCLHAGLHCSCMWAYITNIKHIRKSNLFPMYYVGLRQGTLGGSVIQTFSFACLLGFEVVPVGKATTVVEFNTFVGLPVVVKAAQEAQTRPLVHRLFAHAL